MFSLCAAFLLQAPAHTPRLAFSARYYYPAGDRRMSYHQIYVSDIHGGHRQQLTFDKSEKSDVRWVGRTHLAWLESIGVTKEETWMGSHAPRFESNVEKERRLVLYDLTTRRKRVVSKALFHTSGVIGSPFGDSFSYPRGKPVYFVTRLRGAGTESERDFAYCVYFNGGKALHSKKAPRPAYGNLGAYENGDTPSGDPPSKWDVLPLDKPLEVLTGQFFTVVARDESLTMSEGAARLTYKGRKVIAPQDPGYVWKSKSIDKSWFVIGSFSASAGSDQWLYEVDWKKEKVTLVADTVLNIDFDPERRYWAASSNPKMLAPLGKKRVWQAELWAGDKETKKQWRVAAGAVQGDSISVEPD